MKTAVVRCPKCGRFYYAEQGVCPRCTSAADLRKMARSIESQDRGRLRRILLIGFGGVLLITATSLVLAYSTRGAQKISAQMALSETGQSRMEKCSAT